MISSIADSPSESPNGTENQLLFRQEFILRPFRIPAKSMVGRDHSRYLRFRRNGVTAWCCMACCLILFGCRSVGPPETNAGRATLIDLPSSTKSSLGSSEAAVQSEDGMSSSAESAAATRLEADLEDAENGNPDSPDGRTPAVFAAEASRIRLMGLTDDSASAETDPRGSILDQSLEGSLIAQRKLKLAGTAHEETSAELPESVVNSARPLRFRIPAEIPGASAPPIHLPEATEDRREERKAAILRLFPAPPEVATLPKSSEPPLSLEELEELALQRSPLIVQASAGITMSEGGAIQSGVYPNPVVGYEADTVGSTGTRNYQGIYTSQVVKTGGKLGLQRAIANMELMNSQLAFKRTQLEVRRQVRAGYFNVLVAQEANRINESLVRFMNEVYTIMVERLQDVEAPYATAQLRSLVSQARVSLNQSQNRYIAAWKQLAVATGVPELPPAPLMSRVDMPVPNLDFDALMQLVLSVHPDIEASRNFEAQSKLNLKLQRRVPIPDVTVAGVFQNDFTQPGFQRTSYNLNLSVPVPIFDKNLGNIRTAEGKVQLSAQQLAVTRNQLTSQLADAFERFQTGRVQAEYFRTQVLPDQFRAYQGVYDAHIQGSERVAFGDIIVAQQNLATGVSIYLSSLLQQWVAATDIANLAQLENFQDLFTLPVIDVGPNKGIPPNGYDVPQLPSTEGVNP
jgi:outer membrane protein, heavy metal efflux system